MFAVFRTPRSPVFHPSPWFASELALPACFRASRTQTGSSARLSTCSRCAPPVSLPGTPACDWPVPSYLLPGVRRRDADSFRKGEERRKHGSEETRLRRCSSTAGVAAAPRGQMRRRMRVRPPAAPVAAPAGDLAAEDYFRGRVRRYAPSAAFRELQPSSELPRPELCGVCTLKARPRFFFSAPSALPHRPEVSLTKPARRALPGRETRVPEGVERRGKGSGGGGGGGWRMKKEHVLHCQFSAWYPLFRSLTIKR